MKTPSSSYYTDPIVYKEGFFKDVQEEQAYLAQIAEENTHELARLAKKAKTGSRKPKMVSTVRPSV